MSDGSLPVSGHGRGPHGRFVARAHGYAVAMDDLEQQVLGVLRGSGEAMTPVAVADQLPTTVAVADVALALDRLVEQGEATLAGPPSGDATDAGTYYRPAGQPE